MDKKIVATFVACIFLTEMVSAATNYSYKQTQIPTQYNNQYGIQTPVYPTGNTLKGNVVMVPAGTTVNAVLTSPVSSKYTTTGQNVSLAMGKDFYYGNKLIAPAGSTVSGTVIESVQAKHGSLNGKLCIRFNTIYTPQGTQIPISAVIKTEDSTGVLVGGTKMDVAKEYTKDLAVGSAAGALSGLVFGALAGGSVGRGAALGTAVGAGGGLVKSVLEKGHDVEIPAGAEIDLILTQPISASASNYYYEN